MRLLGIVKVASLKLPKVSVFAFPGPLKVTGLPLNFAVGVTPAAKPVPLTLAVVPAIPVTLTVICGTTVSVAVA